MLLTLAALPAFAADPGTAGYTSKGFTIADASGKNSLNLGVTIQPRFTATLNGDPEASDEDALSDTGLRIRRALFTANGTLAGFVEYRFRIDGAKSFTFPDADGKTQQAAKVPLDDAQIVFKIADPFQVSVGQWKLPFLTQQVTSDSALLFPERAPTSDGVKFGDVKVAGYSYSRDAGIGIQGSIAEKKFEYAAGVFNGDGANVWPPADDGFLFLGRIAVAPLGEFKYDEVDLERGTPRVGVGAGVTLNQHAMYDDEGASEGAASDLRVAGDVRFAAAGLSVNAEAVYASVTIPEVDPATSLGFYAQAGYCLEAGVAPGVRFSRVDPSLATENDAVSQIDGVVNWFLPDPTNKGKHLGHKVQLQLAWTTALLEGADNPLFHQVQVASTLTF